MGNNNDVVFTDTDRLLLQKDEEVMLTNLMDYGTVILTYISVISPLLFVWDNQIMLKL